MALAPIVAVEVGTSRTVALVGEKADDGQVSVIGMGEAASTGVRKGEVINLDHARVGLAEALRQAEESADVGIREVILGLSGARIKSRKHPGAIPVRGRNRVVTREDVEEVIELAGSVNLHETREILHTVRRNFSLDDQTGIAHPEGMQGAQLGVEVLVVHADRNRLDNITRVVEALSMRVTDMVFCGLGAALAVLTPEQKRSGVVVIDLGGGTTDYLAYAADAMAAVGSLALGGDHITNDIALAFNIPNLRAEALKREKGSAMLKPDPGAPRIQLPSDFGFAERTLSPRALQTVIHARVDEILRCVRVELVESGVLPHIGAGIVLTGGGAYLRDLPVLAEQIFGLPCMIGAPVNVRGLADKPQPAAFSGVAGLLLYGYKSYHDSGLILPIVEWIRSFFR